MAQPRRLLNWAVATLLILWAGSGIVFQMMREAVVGRETFRIVGDIYEAPTFLLVLLVIDRLLLVPPRPRAWPPVLVAGTAALAVFLGSYLAFGQASDLVVLRTANYGTSFVAEMAAVLLACRVAHDTSRSVLVRRQAALFGLAFALLLAHSAGLGIWQVLAGGTITGVMSWLGLVGIVPIVVAAVALRAPFAGGPRLAVPAAILLAALAGVTSHGSVLGFTLVGGRAVVVSGFALVLAVAVLRYDLGATQAAERRRVQTAAAALLALCVVAVVAATAWSLSGLGAVPAGIGLAAVVVPVAVLATPLRRLPGWLTRRVLLHPGDSEALRERVRVYASTLRAATAPGGGLAPGAEGALSTLREELGISQRDHDLLMAMGGDPRAGGVVAYRLALAGAEGGALDEARMRQLREDLGVSERDHALVLEHIQATADDLAPGALFLGRYHVLRRLAEGGLSEVWLARDTKAGTDVVVKRLTGPDRRDAAALQRLSREVQASSFEHANVVAVRGVESVGGETYLVMEYMAGGSLADVLRAKGHLPEADVARIGIQVLDALGALHARGFLHRDVKPGNILLDDRGHAKLGDFNVARELVSGDTLGGDAPAGPIGTFAYMPLEQARGLAPRPQSDLYALAATLYEAAAGAPLRHLEGLSHAEAVARIAAAETPESVPNASPAFAAVLGRALARAPEDRYATAADMKAALLAAGVTPPGIPAGSDPRPPRPPP